MDLLAKVAKIFHPSLYLPHLQDGTAAPPVNRWSLSPHLESGLVFGLAWTNRAWQKWHWASSKPKLQKALLVSTCLLGNVTIGASPSNPLGLIETCGPCQPSDIWGRPCRSTQELTADTQWALPRSAKPSWLAASHHQPTVLRNWVLGYLINGHPN